MVQTRQSLKWRTAIGKDSSSFVFAVQERTYIHKTQPMLPVCYVTYLSTTFYRSILSTSKCLVQNSTTSQVNSAVINSKFCNIAVTDLTKKKDVLSNGTKNKVQSEETLQVRAPGSHQLVRGASWADGRQRLRV